MAVVLEAALIPACGECRRHRHWVGSLGGDQLALPRRLPHTAGVRPRHAGHSVVLAVGLAIVLGIGAGFVAAVRMVRTPPLTLFGR